VEALADVPPREQLLARLAGGFQAPLTKAAGLFQAFTRNFAYGIKAYIDQRSDEGAAPEGVSEAPEAPSAEESRDTPAAGEDAAPSGESDSSDEGEN
jgi:hypothetical protein